MPINLVEALETYQKKPIKSFNINKTMNQFKQIANSPTGNVRLQGSVKLVSDLETATILQNSNGKNYKVITVEFVTASGEVKSCGAAIYEGNYSKGGVEKGKEYLATVTIAPNADGKMIPYMQMSHLVAGGGYADLDDFGIEEVEAASTTEAYNGTVIRS